MEDRYSAKVDLHHDSKQAVFGVFDGHGGPKAAEFAAENLDMNIVDEVEKRGDDNTEEAVKWGYLNTDSEFLKQDLRGGACCVTTLIRKGNLVVLNVGDCRVVVSRGGVAEPLASNHRPSRTDERVELKPWVIIVMAFGESRDPWQCPEVLEMVILNNGLHSLLSAVWGGVLVQEFALKVAFWLCKASE